MENLNYNMQNAIFDLYEKINKVLFTQCKLNVLSMTALHAMNYNGFKRWHRYRANQFFRMKIELANELFDRFRIRTEFKDYELTYAPKNLEEHLKSWESATLDAIENLGNCNKEYFNETGIENKIVKKAIRRLSCDYEKIGRLLKRFSESDWLSIDLHIADDKIHEKYKEKENVRD